MNQLHNLQSLKAFNTFNIECTAEQFLSFDQLETLQNICADTALKSRISLILGGGSNILFTKPKIAGLTLHNCLKGIEKVAEDEESIYIKAFAGEVWHDFVEHCIHQNWAGIENLALIPGCIGASPMQNIGAYGVEIKDVFFELEALHIATNEIHRFKLNDCQFGYRESVFKRRYKGEYIILSVTYRLLKNAAIKTSYGAIQQELDSMQVGAVGIREVADAVIRIRRSKLPNPKELGNAGSFFKNPSIPIQQAEDLLKTYPSMPQYPSTEANAKKVAAGWLIEQCGLKGHREAHCGVHHLQALVLVNYGEARGEEVFQLSQLIIDSVFNKFGILLEREVNIL
ncbi:MAG: UDP-N-acetylmuramate dehydrogenase [Chitinophagales bacterium]|nr:UDP-N-acetylmuramate dehydrogenase [Chitinophagales bacterium]